MTDAKSAVLGFASALTTLGVDQWNVWVALAIGLVSLALLLRRAFWAFLGDFRAWRAGRTVTLPPEDNASQRAENRANEGD